MELEDLIKKYPEGINHKPTHAECVKLESILNSSNLSKLKGRLPKLAPFLVSSILNSDEPTIAIAVTNIRTCTPHIREHLQTLIVQELMTIQGNMKGYLEKSGNPARALLVWRTVVYVLGPVLHKNRTTVNTLLIIPEKAFKSQTPVVQKNAFHSWKELVDNFALNPDVLSHAKRLKLVLQPLMSNKSKAEEVQLARATTWWYIAVKLQDKLSAEFDKVCIPLLRFVFQMPADPGKGSSNSSPEAGSQVSQALLLKGSEILLRILEVSAENLPSGLTSPKKQPTISTMSLTVPVSHLAIAKNASFILELMKKSLQFLNTLQPGCTLRQTLLQMLLVRMNFLSKEEGKVEVEAVAEFIQFMHICIKDNLVMSGLKILDKVTRLLSSKVLTSHCYHLASNSTEVMNGVPALGFLDLLFSDLMFPKEISSGKFVDVFIRLVKAGVEETTFYLSFAQRIFDKLKTLSSQEGNSTPEVTDVIVNLWMQTANSLCRKIQKTQEVNQGDSLEHNFDCLLVALTLPMKLQLASSSNVQSKEVEKSWSNLCKAFLRYAGTVNDTDPNVACDQLCSQMVSVLREAGDLDSKTIGWVTYMCGILLSCIDFESMNTMQNTASILQSPERWRKRQQQPLGNITSFVDLLGLCLSSSFQLIKKGDSTETSVLPCFQHTKSLFNSVKLSSSLVSLVVQLGPSLVSYFGKTSDSKKLTPYLKQLEQTWQSIVTAFQVHYKGPHSQDTFNALCPLLEPTLLHSNKSIHERARSLWFSAFSDSYNTLNFPDSFKTVLKEVQPALIPASQISSVDSMTSFEQPSEEKDPPRTPSTRRKTASEAQDSSKKENFVAPKSKKATNKKEKTNSVELLDDQGFVIIPPTNKSTKRILTEHQKEVMKQKSPIPAMYSDLTQETQLTDDNSESLPIVETCSEPPAADVDVPVDVPMEEPEPEPEISNTEDIPVVDLLSSDSSTILNSVPATVDIASESLEEISEPPVEPQQELSSHTPEPHHTPEHHSDDSQLSGTDSPIVLPSGISSTEVRIPRIVKKDIKLKKRTVVELNRVSSESPQKVFPDSSSDSSDVSNKETRRSRRQSSKRLISDETSQSLMDKENAVKPRSILTELSQKKIDTEASTPSKRRLRDIKESPRKATPDKKSKSGKRKGQTTEESVKKKLKPIENDALIESAEDVALNSPLDGAVASDDASKESLSSLNLLTEIGEKVESSSPEVLEVKSKEIEVVDIQESEGDVLENETEEGLNEDENVQDNMEADFEPEGQEVEMQFDLNEIENVEEPVLEEEENAVEDVNTEAVDDEMVGLEEEEELIPEEDADKENIPAEPFDQEMNDLDDDVDPESQIVEDEEEEYLEEEQVKDESPKETSQGIEEPIAEEPKVTETSNGSKKRKSTSPVKSASNRTTVTVGATSRWKVKESTSKKNACSVDKSCDNEQTSEKQNFLDKDSEKNEKENVLVDSKLTLECSVGVTAGKVKPSPVSSRKKALCSAGSPLSRSQLMVEAAMKNRASEVEPASPRTVPTRSTSAKKSLHVFSPTASPSTGILKGKPGSPPSGQKRRVSFADPPVHPDSSLPNSPSGIEAQKTSTLSPVEETEQLEKMDEDILESEVLNTSNPVYPDLIGCEDSVQEFLPLLTSSLWTRGLDKLLRSKHIRTIGDLSALKCSEVLSLPIVKPKVKTLRAALEKYHQKHSKRLSINSASDSKVPSPPLLNDEEEEHFEPAGMKDVDQEVLCDSELEKEEVVDNASQESVSNTQELLITQVPSHVLSSEQDDEDEEEMEKEMEEEAADSPPLPSMEDAFNDKDILNSSLFQPNADYSSLLNEATDTSEKHESNLLSMINPVNEIAPINSASECVGSVNGSTSKDQPPSEPAPTESKLEKTLKECNVKELLDALGIIQRLLNSKLF